MTMNAEKPGVWTDQLTENLTMICDTNVNTIRIVNRLPQKPAIRYDFPDGILISDVEQIRNGILNSIKK